MSKDKQQAPADAKKKPAGVKPNEQKPEQNQAETKQPEKDKQQAPADAEKKPEPVRFVSQSEALARARKGWAKEREGKAKVSKEVQEHLATFKPS